jgi:hypothetical protein
VVVAYIPDCSSLEYNFLNSVKDLDLARRYVKKAEEEIEGLTCLDYIIYPHEVNKTNYNELCRRKVNHGASRLLFEQKLQDPLVTLTSANIPAAKELRCVVNPEHPSRFLLRAISYLKRQSLLEGHYSKILRGYNIASDLGKLSLDSIETLLSKDVNQDFFIIESLQEIPRIVLTELRNLNPKALCHDYLQKTPDWWKTYFSKDLKDSLTTAQLEEYSRLSEGQPEFLSTLPKPKEYKCLNNN